MNLTDRAIEIAGVPHYLARAAQPTTAGVLLIPHVYGIDEFVRDYADGLAAAGLTTIAWNPYPAMPWGEPFKERPPRPNDKATIASLSTCIDSMETTLGLRSYATIGFCMGGRFGLLHAERDRRLSAVVAAYPSIPPQRQPGQDLEPIPAAGRIACPVQLLYPGQDRVTPRPVFEALQVGLQGRDAETSILFFPNAGHGFFHDHNEANDAATRVADPQIKAFLLGHLTA